MQEEQRAIRFIESQKWIFAKTMADIPHWYCLKKNNADDAEWLWFVNYMLENSVQGEFYGRKYRYFYLGKYRYWQMDPAPDECDLVNRCLIADIS